MNEIIYKCFTENCNNLLIIEKNPCFQHWMCKSIYCIWCVYSIFVQGYTKFLESTLKYSYVKIEYYNVSTRCCNRADYSILNSFKLFLQQNCITCGQRCQEKQRYNLNFCLFIGRKCYWKMFENANRTQYENICIQKIQQLAQIKCIDCKQIDIHIVTGSECQIDKHICQQCSKKKSIRFCINCKSKEQLEHQTKTTSILIFGTKTQIGIPRLLLTEFQHQIYCHYCIFQKILQNKNQFRNWKISQVQFLQKQIKFQKFFWVKCIVCGYQMVNESQKLFLIPHEIVDLSLFFCVDCRQLSINEKMLNWPLQQFNKLLKVYKLLNKKNFVYTPIDGFIKIVSLQNLNSQLKSAKLKQPSKQFDHKSNRKQNILHQQPVEDGSEYYDAIDDDKRFSQQEIRYNNSQIYKIQDQQINFNEKNAKKMDQLNGQNISIELTPFQKLTQLKLSQPQTHEQIAQAVLSGLKNSLKPQFIDKLQHNMELFIQSLNDNKQQKQVYSPIKTQIRKDNCAMQWCRNVQRSLNLDSMCDECFYRYLLGDKQITDKFDKLTKKIQADINRLNPNN